MFHFCVSQYKRFIEKYHFCVHRITYTKRICSRHAKAMELFPYDIFNQT